MSRGTKRKIFRWILISSGLGLLAGASLIFWADHAAEAAGENRLFDDPSDLPATPVALVFGCAKTVNGLDNLYFTHRIEAATTLWKSGKIQGLIVSGDNCTTSYSEPDDMKAALVATGVPPEKIVCDYAGLRTLDSVVRAKEIFGVDSLVLVSQKFHNERAAYLAQSIGLEVVGLNAESVTGAASTKTNVREKLARVKMWLDVKLLRTRPRHSGQKEPLPFLNPPPAALDTPS